MNPYIIRLNLAILEAQVEGRNVGYIEALRTLLARELAFQAVAVR